MKKLFYLGSMVIMLLFAFSISAAAALNITNAELLPDAYINTPYEPVQLVTEGGSGEYTYTLIRQTSIPPGMELSASGVISGTPTVGGTTYSDLEIVVADNVTGETSNKMFTIRVYSIRVDFNITETVHTYDGQPHQVKAVPMINGEDASGLIDNYTITYAGELSQTNAGSYRIQIKVNNAGYGTGTLNANYMTIAANPNVDIEFSNLEFQFSGAKLSPSVLVTGHKNETEDENITDYKLTYEGVYGTSYTLSTTPPQMPGRYRIKCDLENGNYVTPSNNTAIFTILPTIVDFELQSENKFRYGSDWNADYKITPTIPKANYNIKYVKDGVEYDKPVDAGVYQIQVTLRADTQYKLGTVAPSTVTVEPQHLTFAVSPSMFFTNDEDKTVNVVPEADLIENVDYRVKFLKDGIEQEINEEGIYDVSIEMLNNNYEIINILPSKIVVVPPDTEEKIPVYFVERGIVYFTGDALDINMSNTSNLVMGEDYIVTYKKNGEVVTPINAGSYEAEITLIGDAADRYEIIEAPTEFVINPKPVYFTINNGIRIYNSQVQTPDILNDYGLTEGNDYTVTYARGSLILVPREVSPYRIIINITNPNYVYDGQSLSSFEIIADYHTVNLKYDSRMGDMNFVTSGNQYQIGDTVQISVAPKPGYRLLGVTVANNAVTLDENYMFTMIAADVEINAEFERIADINLDFGNSIAASIEKNSAVTDKQAAKDQFMLSRNYGDVYNIKHYSANAWGSADLDMDEYALFVYNRIETDLPQGTGYNSNDEEAALTVTLKAPDGDIDVTGQTRIRMEDIPIGIYQIEYKFFDEVLNEDVIKTRNIVVLWNIGDVNMDRNTNSADANWLIAHSDIAETTDNEKLFKFRICDVDKDGIVDEQDSNAILNRVNRRIEQYYR